MGILSERWRDFLEELYNCLDQHEQITTTRLCDTLEASRSIETLATGSWIDGDFGVWIAEQPKIRHGVS